MNLSSLFQKPLPEGANPFLDPDRERRIALYEKRAQDMNDLFTGKPAAPEVDPQTLWKDMQAGARLAALPMYDDLEDEFDDDVEHATTKALLKCEHFSVDALDLGVRARRALFELRVHTIGELCAYTQADLKAAFGALSVAEVLDRLRERGIVLAPS